MNSPSSNWRRSSWRWSAPAGHFAGEETTVLGAAHAAQRGTRAHHRLLREAAGREQHAANPDQGISGPRGAAAPARNERRLGIRAGPFFMGPRTKPVAAMGAHWPDAAFAAGPTSLFLCAGNLLRKPLEFGHFHLGSCLLYTSPSPRDGLLSRM